MRHDKQTTGARSESIFFVCQKIAQKEADVQFVTTALSLSLSLSLSLALSLVPLDLPVRPGAPRPGGGRVLLLPVPRRLQHRRHHHPDRRDLPLPGPRQGAHGAAGPGWVNPLGLQGLMGSTELFNSRERERERERERVEGLGSLVLHFCVCVSQWPLRP